MAIPADGRVGHSESSCINVPDRAEGIIGIRRSFRYHMLIDIPAEGNGYRSLSFLINALHPARFRVLNDG